jgi:hypothetical protein
MTFDTKKLNAYLDGTGWVVLEFQTFELRIPNDAAIELRDFLNNLGDLLCT